MSFFKKLFGTSAKPRTLLDDFQEVSGRLIVKSYRRIGAQLGCAPTAKTTDAKIVEIYSTIVSTFSQAAKQRGEHIPALYLNTIVLKFLKVHELFFGSPFPQKYQEHLQYEVNKYLAEGLRPDYKQELQLFDPDNLNDPDVILLNELTNKAVLGRSETKMERCYKSAQAGDAESQYTIGIQYEQGQSGYPKDYAEAAKWYRKAAEQGHAGAQLYLGVFLAQGQGVKPDFVEAYKWIELAKRGNALDKVAAIDCQKRLVAYLTPAQVAEGQRLSSEFVPKSNC